MPNKICQIVLIFLIITVFSSFVYAQQPENSGAGLYEDYLLDNSKLDKSSDRYYVINETDSIKWQKPTVAFFKSMLFPGWGQLGNRQYIKAGIVIGIEVTLIGTMLHYAEKTSDAKKAFDDASVSGDDFLIWQTFGTFDKAKDNRNLFSWLSGAFIFLSMFDAYVDAHMAQFPKYDKKISLQINSEGQENIKAVVALKF